MTAEPPLTSVRLAQVADVHVGSHDLQVVQALLDDLHAWSPDVTAVCGDLTMRARRREFAQARMLLEALPQPVIVVPGNHDIPLFHLPRRLTRPYEKYQEGLQPDLDPVLDLPGVRLLGLNTMPRWRWKAGRASARQCRMVESVLGSAPPGSVRALVTHHPLLPRDLSSFTGRSGLAAACARAGVDLLLAGHTHDPMLAPIVLTADGARQGALSSVTGTSTSTRLRAAENAYLRLALTPTSIDAEIRASDGGPFRTVLRAGFRRQQPVRAQQRADAGQPA